MPQTNMPTEKTSPTQPIPTNPPPYSRTFVGENDLIDFTPALRAQALENLKKFRWEQSPFVPPLGPNDQRFGSINIGNTGGGVNWPGSGFDPETGIFYTQADNDGRHHRQVRRRGVRQVRRRQADRNGQPQAAVGSRSGLRLRRHESAGRRRRRAGQAPRPAAAQAAPGRDRPTGAGRRARRLPIVKPPYGVIAAIDLNAGGKLLFQVPHGETPDNVRNHPLLRGMNIPKTGQGASVGIMVTKTMAVAGDPQITAPPGRARGAMLRAYDKKTGAQVGEVLMPAAISGSPMTYMVDGRQYIIVAVSGGNYTGEYIAYALPQSEMPRHGELTLWR